MFSTLTMVISVLISGSWNCFFGLSVDYREVDDGCIGKAITESLGGPKALASMAHDSLITTYTIIYYYLV